MKSQKQVQAQLAKVQMELQGPVTFLRQVYRLNGYRAALEWVLATPLPKDIKPIMSKHQSAVRLKALRKRL